MMSGKLISVARSKNSGLRIVVHRDASLEVKHQQLQEMADLYHFFKPTVDHYSPVN